MTKVIREVCNSVDTVLKIGKLEFDVVSSCRLSHEGEMIYGFCHYGSQVIYVEEEMCKQAQDVTIMHEVLHAIFDQVGEEQDEGRIDRLSHALYAFILDNKEFINDLGS